MQAHLTANDYDVAEPTNESIALDAVLRSRGDLLEGRHDIIQSVDPITAMHLLSDRDACLGYAESLAAEAAVWRARGEELRAQTLEARALAVASAMPNEGHRDNELAEFVDGLRRRREATVSSS